MRPSLLIAALALASPLAAQAPGPFTGQDSAIVNTFRAFPPKPEIAQQFLVRVHLPNISYSLGDTFRIFSADLSSGSLSLTGSALYSGTFTSLNTYTDGYINGLTIPLAPGQLYALAVYGHGQSAYSFTDVSTRDLEAYNCSSAGGCFSVSPSTYNSKLAGFAPLYTYDFAPVTTAPEPTTFWLLGVGGLAVTFLRLATREQK